MAHSAPKNPAYRLHKPSGQAVVSFPLGGGKYADRYLGAHGSDDSCTQYERLIAEWLANGRCLRPEAGPTLTVGEVLDAYWADVRQSLWRFDALTGARIPSSMQTRIKCALRGVRDLYGTAPVSIFGPLALKAVRKKLIARDLSRVRINQLIDCVKRCFSWAVSEELVPESIAAALDRVSPLASGRSTAPEPKKVRPVPPASIPPVLKRVLPQVAALIQFQLLTGARPGEAVILRPGDLDRGGDVWIYRPARHKTQDLGAERLIFIGPQAQTILLPFLVRAADAFCFSPKEGELARQKRQGQKCKTRAGDRYSVSAYSRAIRRACEQAGIPQWHAHQLRHNAASALCAEFGYETARIVLGHRSLQATKIYVEDNQQRAAEAMKKVG